MSGVDELAVPAELLLNKQFGNCLTAGKASWELF
jgi:hypothetical protein